MAKNTLLATGLLTLALTVASIAADAQQKPQFGAGLGQRCGGLVGIQCAKGLWCDPDPGQCNTADGQGTCVNPQSCATIIIPVCGCDGKTYARECERQKARVAKKHENRCQR